MLIVELEGTWVHHEIGFKFTLKSLHKHKFIIRMLFKSIDKEPIAILKDIEIDHEFSFKTFERTLNMNGYLKIND